MHSWVWFTSRLVAMLALRWTLRRVSMTARSRERDTSHANRTMASSSNRAWSHSTQRRLQPARQHRLHLRRLLPLSPPLLLRRHLLRASSPPLRLRSLRRVHPLAHPHVGHRSTRAAPLLLLQPPLPPLSPNRCLSRRRCPACRLPRPCQPHRRTARCLGRI